MKPTKEYGTEMPAAYVLHTTNSVNMMKFEIPEPVAEPPEAEAECIKVTGSYMPASYLGLYAGVGADKGTDCTTEGPN